MLSECLILCFSPSSLFSFRESYCCLWGEVEGAISKEKAPSCSVNLGRSMARYEKERLVECLPKELLDTIFAPPSPGNGHSTCHRAPNSLPEVWRLILALGSVLSES